ncbi:transcriptional regulator [Streptomyces sp. NPDC005917]|uniref:ArsR/SmtB family transcription factor n=1 Tax=unclassified Streptomyces TaxID=2593676 RepID=UPI0033E50068
MSNDELPTSSFPEPGPADVDLVAVLRALADPVRLRIVNGLRDGAFHRCAADEYGVAVHKTTMSHHFKVLREAGVTSTRVRGRDHAVRLRRADLDQRFPGLLDALLAAAPGPAPAADTPHRTPHGA